MIWGTPILTILGFLGNAQAHIYEYLMIISQVWLVFNLKVGQNNSQWYPNIS